MPTYKLTDPHFNEYVYNALVTASVEQKSRLPFDFYAAATSTFAAKRFIDTASLEKKIACLGYLGIEFAMYFGKRETLNEEFLKAEIKREKRYRATAINKMIENNSFCFTDREVLAALIVKAQDCHTETYVLNRGYYNISSQVTSLQEYADVGAIEAAKPAMSEFKLLVKFALNLLMHQGHLDGLTHFKELQMSILLYLFVHQNKYVVQKSIVDYLTPAFLKNSIIVSLTRLRTASLLDLYPAASSKKEKSYIITSKGMLLIQGFLLRTVNHTFNY